MKIVEVKKAKNFTDSLFVSRFGDSSMRFWRALPFGLMLSILLNASVAPVQAETQTQYVTDRLQVTLRAGESIRYKILRTLESGTRLEVLAIDRETDYARVRTEDGTLGYILANQLQQELPARLQIADIQAQLNQLRQQPETCAAELAKLQSEHAILVENAQALKQSKQQLEQELATIRHASSNVLEIANDRDRLRIQVSELSREREELMHAHEEIKNQTQQRWFLIGVAVLGGGIVIGAIFPHLTVRRRKNHWGNF